MKPRAGSAKRRLFEYALRRPVFTAEIAAQAGGVAITNVFRDLPAMQGLGFFNLSGEYQGPAVWGQQGVLGAIDAFAKRAGRRSGIKGK